MHAKRGRGSVLCASRNEDIQSRIQRADSQNLLTKDASRCSLGLVRELAKVYENNIAM